jgi:hypothetical protein
MSDIADIVETIVLSGLASEAELQGCTEAELTHLESTLGLGLPRAYREFLLRAGRGAGRLFRGTDVFYPTLLNLREWADELLEEDSGRFVIPADAVVIGMHQGYQFLYLRVGEGDDPPVYRYVEGQEDSEKIADAFSRYLADAVDDFIVSGAAKVGDRKR